MGFLKLPAAGFLLAVCLLPPWFSAYGEAFDKEQIIISENAAEFVDRDGSVDKIDYENDSFFVDESGTAYVSLNCLLDTLNAENYERYTADGILYVVNGNTQYITIDLENSDIEFSGRKSALKNDVVVRDNRIFVPLRELMNMAGYKDSQILYNKTMNAICLNKYPLFETDKITVTDNAHYTNEENISKDFLEYDVSNAESIDSLVWALNRAPLYSCDVRYGSIYPVYELDFNNGVVMDIQSYCVCKIYIDGKYAGQYQMPFELSKSVESFIEKEVPDYDIAHSSWWHGSDMEKEYITWDYMSGDYKEIIDYIKSGVEDFDGRYNYNIEKRDNDEIYIVVTRKEIPESQYRTSLRIYEYPGAMEIYRLDGFIEGLK